MQYTVCLATTAPPLQAEWADPVWAGAQTLQLAHFRPESSDHRPQTSARMLYDARGLYGIFRVQDRYVRCVRTQYLDSVWRDSCVEFYVQPRTERGYFNFEFNCGGAFLCFHVINPERQPDGFFKDYVRVPAAIGGTLRVRSSLPRTVEPEITEPVEWTLAFFIPFTLFEHYLGKLGPMPGQLWRANFYKCADESSHPHWASWSPLDQFNFHRPNCFGSLVFA